ncbi:hypothetical protein IHE44_0013354 [Lamprotornis superbus]|uniref:RING-type domain-containing protein n=1 Tax=Lamprotornis superbus TaxID=245042 RepID=A0A835TQE9_9PASS|nr:hypothetical protein IHE44_0013354 [Lamprotornis superbus]
MSTHANDPLLMWCLLILKSTCNCSKMIEMVLPQVKDNWFLRLGIRQVKLATTRAFDKKEPNNKLFFLFIPQKSYEVQKQEKLKSAEVIPTSESVKGTVEYIICDPGKIQMFLSAGASDFKNTATETCNRLSALELKLEHHLMKDHAGHSGRALTACLVCLSFSSGSRDQQHSCFAGISAGISPPPPNRECLSGMGTERRAGQAHLQDPGKEIVSLLERNITVMMYITIGTRNLQKYVSRTSVVFVSISFIVLMIISLAWLVFYYIQRFRYANARDRNQRRLGDAAKKAISKLQVRTIRKGDKETEPDFDNCAVCIEGYKPNDVVRILPCRHLFHKSCVDPWLLDHRTCPMCKMNILKALGIPPNADCMDDIPPDLEASIGGAATNQITGASDITVNESSVALDPPARALGVLQVIQDVDSFPQAGEGNFTTSNEQEPAVSSDSDISLIMAMEVGLSDVELSTDQDCEEVKS